MEQKQIRRFPNWNDFVPEALNVYRTMTCRNIWSAVGTKHCENHKPPWL